MNDAILETILGQRFAAVEERIATACLRAGRRREEVTLVAVTKTVSPEIAKLMPELGVLDLGESRPQELWRKAAALPPSMHWHLIGHLQRNKIERTLPLVCRVHSVDSLRLLNAIDEDAARRNATIDALIEVNITGEERKHGFAPTDVLQAALLLGTLQNVHINGLMTMAEYADDPEHSRPAFTALRKLRDTLRPLVEPPHTLDHLSMGMSNDFEVAIDEGATMIRLGSVLFQDLPA